MAEENAAAGTHLARREHVRAAASRFYYSAFQAAHAVLFTTPLRAGVPRKGNWDHAPLANAIKNGAAVYLRYDQAGAEHLRKQLVAAMHARVIADYGAGIAVDAKSLASAKKAAEKLIALAHRHGALGQ